MFASGLQKSYLKKNCNENTKIKQTMRLELEEVETMNNAAGTTMLMTMSLFPIVKMTTLMQFCKRNWLLQYEDEQTEDEREGQAVQLKTKTVGHATTFLPR